MEKDPLFHNRPLLFSAAGLLLGTVFWARLPGRSLFVGAALMLLCGLLALKLKKRVWGLLFLWAFLGLVRGQTAALPQPMTGHHLALTGKICEEVTVREGGYTLTLSQVVVEQTPYKGRLRLILTGDGPLPAYGQTVRVSAAEIALPDGKYRAGDYYHGIGGVAFAKTQFAELGPAAQDFYGRLLLLRAAIGARIDQLFSRHQGVAKAMLLGDKNTVEEDTLAAFRRTGVLHLMAVSGLHTGILAGAFSLLFRGDRRIRFLGVCLFLLSYCALTAFSPSVLRASVMTMCLFAAPLFYRRPDTLSALSLSFLLIVLWNPYALFYVGFQLSFGAVFGICTLGPRLFKPLSRLGSAFGGLLSSSLSVLAGTLPLMSAHFSETSLTSVLTNILILPLAPLFLVPAFLAVALSFVASGLGRVIGHLAAPILDLIVAITARGGGFSLRLPPPPWEATLLFLFALLLLSPACGRARGAKALLGGGVLALSLLIWVMV